MSGFPAFSVVTPSFGQLSWLELCIASVADQAVEGGVEHIVCDGGSSGMEEFVRAMRHRFPDGPGYRLRFEVGPDKGMYDAINKGLRLAAGGVCSYLNCDEQLLPGALEGVAGHFLSEAASEVVFGDALVVDRGGNAMCYWRPYVPTLHHLSGATLNTLSCSTFFRRSIVEAGILFDPEWKVVGDLLWIRRLLEEKRRMHCLRRPLAAFTFLGDNLGASSTADHEFERTRRMQSPSARLAGRCLHGARKLASGAYVRRRMIYNIFTLSDPLQRRHFEAGRLGWTWPSTTKPHASV